MDLELQNWIKINLIILGIKVMVIAEGCFHIMRSIYISAVTGKAVP
jgi:hypothetical protein